MQKSFSKYLKSKKPVMVVLLDRLQDKYEHVGILGTDTMASVCYVDYHSSNVGEASDDCGFVIKVVHDGIYSEYATNELTMRRLDKIEEKIDELVKANMKTKKVGLKLAEEEKLTQSFSRRNKGKYLSEEEIIAGLKETVDLFKQEEKIVHAGARFVVEEVSKVYLSKNKDLEQYYFFPSAFIYSVAADQGKTQMFYNSVDDISMSKVLKALPKKVKETASVARELLVAENPEPGIYDVITAPSISGLIAHEAFGHGVEMDQFVKDRALGKEYINKPVASNLVSMRDGAASCFAIASYFFDDDGILAQDTLVIDKGILKQGISDVNAASMLGTKPTGNGRRQAYDHKTYTRMTNTFFEPGKDKLKDMIKSIEYGYLIDVTNNGMEDPKNWQIQCTATIGREIKNGKLTGKVVSPIIMSGYVIDLLKSISAVSDDFKINSGGSCGKGYKEWVRVSDGGPYMKAKVKIG